MIMTPSDLRVMMEVEMCGDSCCVLLQIDYARRERDDRLIQCVWLQCVLADGL